jgi:hypothetical protein
MGAMPFLSVEAGFISGETMKPDAKRRIGLAGIRGLKYRRVLAVGMALENPMLGRV